MTMIQVQRTDSILFNPMGFLTFATLRLIALGVTLSSALLLSTRIQALPDDRQLPVKVVAQSLEYDRSQNAIIYTGEVVITQGTLVLKGDRIIIKRSEEGGIQTITVRGKPAYFKDQIESGQADTVATGKTMTYDEQKRALTIKGKASVVRGEDQFKGHHIRYLLDKSTLAAESHPSKGTSDDGRIEMIIQPGNLNP